jgi:hypothetical protein
MKKLVGMPEMATCNCYASDADRAQGCHTIDDSGKIVSDAAYSSDYGRVRGYPCHDHPGKLKPHYHPSDGL